MKSLKCYYDGALFYEALYILDKQGMRGMIKSSRTGEKKNETESNAVTDFYFGPTGNLHFSSNYLYQESIRATLAFEYLKKQLFKLAYDNGSFELDSEQLEAFKGWLVQYDVPQLKHSNKELTNMDNLAYLFEQMMLFECDPTVTSDFIEKLELVKPLEDDEFEQRAFEIIQNIYRISNSDDLLERMKIQMLSELTMEEMKIFKDFQKHLKSLGKLR